MFPIEVHRDLLNYFRNIVLCKINSSILSLFLSSYAVFLLNSPIPVLFCQAFATY